MEPSVKAGLYINFMLMWNPVSRLGNKLVTLPKFEPESYIKVWEAGGITLQLLYVLYYFHGILTLYKLIRLIVK